MQLLLELPVQATHLWTRFQQDLCSDYQLRHHPAQAANLSIEEMSRYLRSQGSSLAQCGLPEPQRLQLHNEIDQELDFFHPHLPLLRTRADAAYADMNSDQRSIYDCILNDHPSNQKCFFIDGRAGRGKTFLMKAICNHFRGKDRIVAVTGTTALCVLYYDRGRTAHSAFGIPVTVPMIGRY